VIELRTSTSQVAGLVAASGERDFRCDHLTVRRRRWRSATSLVTVQAILLTIFVQVTCAEELPVFTANELGVSVSQWTVENGLPTQDLRALAQTPDGYIWCGTSRGLVRFDGVKFTTWDGTKEPVLEGMEVTELTVDGEGRLWILSQQKEEVELDHGVFHRVSVGDGLPEPVDLPRVDGQGRLWLRGSNAFYCLEKGMFLPKSFSGINHRDVVDLCFGSDARDWAVLEEGYKLAEIGVDQNPEFISAPDSTFFGRFFKMQDGSVGLLTSQGVCKFQEGGLSYLRRGGMLGHKSLVLNGGACEDPSGNLWIGTYDQGLIVWLPNGRAGNFNLGAEDVTWIRALLCDRQGNVWVGKRDGLFRLRPTVFRNWEEEAGMERSYVYSLAAGPDGAIWFANGWELSCLHPKAQKIERVLLPPAADKTWRVHVSRDGTVWAGDRAGQVFRRVNGSMQRVGGVAEEVTAMFDSRDGTLWLGSTEGLWRLAGSRFRRVRFRSEETPVAVRSITEDSRGQLNVLASEVGIFVREAESWRPLTGFPKTAEKFMATLYADQHGVLWITLASHGFGRLVNGQWSQYELSTPSGPAALEGVAVDDDGYVWLPSNNGLFRFHQNLLVTNASSRTITEYRQFDRQDGLGSAVCTSIAYVAGGAGQGRVWVGTQNGAAETSLEMLANRRQHSEPPRTLIETVQWDDEVPIAPAGFSKEETRTQVLVPAGALRLRITYTATDVEFPEKVSFQFRLLGLSPNWVQAGTERVASFLKLSAGHYQFQVRSANRHGDWNLTPALLDLRVLPAWWQQVWFRAGVAVVGAGLLWLAYIRRMRRVNREQALRVGFSRQLIRSQEQERQRIAGDLHDSLGQNLLVAKNLALIGLNGGTSPAETAKQFHDISHAVSEALSETRRISKALRPPELDRMGLTKALRGMVQRASEASGIECRITMDDIDGLLPASEEINIYRLVQEAMNNIVKHSQAGRVEVQLRHHPNHLELSIADDGRGFDVNKVRDSDSPHAGVGLTGMEERTRLAGGDFRITSRVGSGTVVNIRIPVKAPKA